MIPNDQIKPLFDNVVIEPIENTPDEVFLVGEAEQKKIMKGKVLSVGVGIPDQNGYSCVQSIEVGSTVLFNRFAANDYEHDEKQYYILNASAIIATV